MITITIMIATKFQNLIMIMIAITLKRCNHYNRLRL